MTSRTMCPHPTPRLRQAQAILAWATLCLCAALLSACGPTQSTIRINEAEVAFEKAQLNKASEAAPYEYHSARLYLHKAKEEWGYSDFEAALDYATRSKEMAEMATRMAKGEDPSPGAQEERPSTAPTRVTTPPGRRGSSPLSPGRTRPKTTSDDPDADALEGIR